MARYQNTQRICTYNNFWIKGRIGSCRFLRILTYTDDELFKVSLLKVNDSNDLEVLGVYDPQNIYLQ